MPKITHTHTVPVEKAPCSLFAALALFGVVGASWQSEISQEKLAKVTECGQTEAINEIKTKE